MAHEIKNENFIVVAGWMVTRLGLKGNELLIYAAIYGYTQAEQQSYTGSLQYLANWTNSTRQGVLKCLKSLVEKGLLTKVDVMVNGVKFCEYRTTEFNGGVKQSLTGCSTEFNGGVKQSLTNNISDISKDILLDNRDIENAAALPSDDITPKPVEKDSKRETPKSQAKDQRFVKPTIEDVSSYCSERQNTVDAERFIDYYTANGWKVGKSAMKDWKAAVRNWERHDTPRKAKKGPDYPVYEEWRD